MIEPIHSPESPAEVALAVRRINQQTLELLPAAGVLLAFELLAIGHGFEHLTLVQRAALAGSAIWTGGCIALFILVLRRARCGGSVVQPTETIESIGLTLAGTASALLVAATTDIVLAVVLATGAVTLAAFVAGLLLVVTGWICWIW